MFYRVFRIVPIIMVAFILLYFSKRWSNWRIAVVGVLFTSVAMLG
ncbi:hypothetical protein HNQ69_000304 [Bartonella callosciuri]|uniref:Uncharacterized protein n=1 Tax=Bartonella callosciuri TaxID=686223 RepID=A0A840NMU7_9HYPH|nr:hypothetical protein [Bartonella callosciuri]MBB5073200.1 hypothetical protein [Bartonella callosciuri]